ncbi:hypothetical protein [Aerococcus sp. UMB7834]|nr:hypothetical protein [Aerococcus sp. UMB7834]MDK6804292.1 hypothetical protein [Aerococcus sp. UMB7834]
MKTAAILKRFQIHEVPINKLKKRLGAVNPTASRRLDKSILLFIG